MGGGRRRWLALALGTALLALAFWGGNAWARSAGYVRGLAFDDLSPPDDVGWIWLADQHVQPPEGGTLDINGLGLRSPVEVSRERPADAFRILCVGDSFTHGQGVAWEETFARRLELALRDRLATRGGEVVLDGSRRVRQVEVLNAGVNGWNSCQEAAWMRWAGQSLHPDVVVVGFVMNDVLPVARTVSPRSFPGRRWMLRWPLYQWMRHVYLHEWRLAGESAEAVHLQQVIDEQRGLLEFAPTASPEMTAFWRDAVACLRSLHVECLVDGVPVVLMVFPTLPQMQHPDPRPGPQVVLASLAREEQMPLVDLLDRYARAGEAALQTVDHSHPSALGHQIAADELLAALDRAGLLGALGEHPGGPSR